MSGVKETDVEGGGSDLVAEIEKQTRPHNEVFFLPDFWLLFLLIN